MVTGLPPISIIGMSFNGNALVSAGHPNLGGASHHVGKGGLSFVVGARPGATFASVLKVFGESMCVAPGINYHHRQ